MQKHLVHYLAIMSGRNHAARRDIRAAIRQNRFLVITISEPSSVIGWYESEAIFCGGLCAVGRLMLLSFAELTTRT